ncbi:hypothetical protein DFH09DRAFT_1087714 [Mycena vulgaris]|nr:hypothetical protein DFH09DRAFT_1087714 [Mycena vulgaris]
MHATAVKISLNKVISEIPKTNFPLDIVIAEGYLDDDQALVLWGGSLVEESDHKALAAFCTIVPCKKQANLWKAMFWAHKDWWLPLCLFWQRNLEVAFFAPVKDLNLVRSLLWFTPLAHCAQRISKIVVYDRAVLVLRQMHLVKKESEDWSLVVKVSAERLHYSAILGAHTIQLRGAKPIKKNIAAPGQELWNIMKRQLGGTHDFICTLMKEYKKDPTLGNLKNEGWRNMMTRTAGIREMEAKAKEWVYRGRPLPMSSDPKEEEKRQAQRAKYNLNALGDNPLLLV